MALERIRFADSALDDVASVLCTAQPRAAEYIAQAPVLALLSCGKFGSHVTYGEVDRFAAECAAEPRLRDLLAKFDAPTPARKLVAGVLRAGDGAAVRQILRLDASTLSQVIPAPTGQRSWLDGVAKWLKLTPSSKKERAKFSVAWIARQLAADQSRVEQVDSVLDFVARGGGVINERWNWDRALAEVGAWHRRLNDEESLRRLMENKRRAEVFDIVICKAPLPDRAEIDGFEFTVLRTPRALRDEGVVMHHCVGSYAGDVKRGRCAIVSVARNGVRVATIEINAKGAVVQMKAHCNNAVSPAVRKSADAYAFAHWKPASTSDDRA